MNKPNRKRNKMVTIRMNESEYSDLQDRIQSSGLTKQAYIISATLNAMITPSDEIAVLRDLSITFADLEKQLRGLATNINQLAHVANGKGELPTRNELENISSSLADYRQESEKLWQSIRSSINRQAVTPQ